MTPDSVTLRPFSTNIDFYCRLIIYLFSVYAAFYLFSHRNPSLAPRKKKDTKNSTTLRSFLRRNSADPNDDDMTPRSCPTLSPDSIKTENESNQWHPRRSSPSKKRVRLSCVPFEGPRPRIDAGMAIDKRSGNLILHGGASAQSSSLGDTLLFDCDKLHWSQFDITQNHRQKHGIEVTNDGIVVAFGGFDIDTNSMMAHNILRTIDLSQKDLYWKDHNSTQDDSLPSPQPRHRHGMCLCGDNQIAIFGGRDCLENRLNDLWMLNTEALMSHEGGENIWTKIKPEGCIQPKPRASPSIVHLDGNIFLFGQTSGSRGEVELFNLNTRKWERHVTCGEEPLDQDCRVHFLGKAAQLVTISNNESSSCAMFNRLDILDIQTNPMTWSSVDISWYGDWTMIPGPRRCFASSMDSSAGLLYVFGGVEGSSQMEDEEGTNVLDTLIVANFSHHNHGREE